LNEEDNLKELLPYLLEYGGESLLEIIIADGGSKDNTIAIAEAHGAVVVHAIRNRATQMNQGAEHAKGDLLYFVHADTRPYSEYAKIIQASVSNGKKVGCFRYRFDSNSALLRCNAWFTRFNGIFSGGGDQSLFITKTLFNSLEGFDTSFSIMEDFELVRRIRQNFDFQVLPYEMTVSARKYEENSWLKVQLANFIAFSLFLIKVKPAKIKSLYLNFLSK
jgi:rSAM/selenodomain-associated transferase 2